MLNDKDVPITTKTIIELKEHFSISDYITSNLQTVHNYDILQTQGMIYYTVKTIDGASVHIDKSKPIHIEIPVNQKVEEAKFFKGKRDITGSINWADIEEPSKLLIPFPIRFISQKQTDIPCCDYYGISKDTSESNWCPFNYYDDIDNYEHTFIATREFKERIEQLCQDSVLKIYISNLNKNLWEADQEVLKYFIRDSIKNAQIFFNYINKLSKSEKEEHMRLLAHSDMFGHLKIELCKKFVEQKLTKVDTSKKDADSTIMNLNKAFMAYDALEFGWVNVDYFFKDPKAENIKLSARTNHKVIIINLIIPSRNIILSGFPKNENEYSFTKNQDGYNKLPKGEKAILCTISIENNRLYFADKEIILGQNQIETLTLVPTTGEVIKSKMKNYGG